MANLLHVFRKIIRNGVEIRLKRKRFRITYNQWVWNKFPKSLHKSFADGLTYISTWHLPLINNVQMVYHFPYPPIESVFYKMLLYSMPMTLFESDKEISTSEIIKKFYNANFQTRYKALNPSYSGKKVKKILKERAVVLFSFGKESLLTYGLLKEMGVTPILFFMREPQNIYENTHKKKLAVRFYRKFNEKVNFFSLSFGRLRQSSGFAWGWDIVLSQYAYVLLPFYFYYQAKYLFLGNEQSCNFSVTDKENYLINPVFEQSVSAMQLLQSIPKLFFIQTHIGSLVEPINELFITYILHHRYPEIGRYQMSCFSESNEAKKKRWCGVCEKCARIYIFLRALNISPERVGFYNNDMLSLKKMNYYVIFNGGVNQSAYGGSGLGKEEQLLAFYLAYKNGVRGPLINKFKKTYLPLMEKKKKKLIKKYLGIHSSLSLPSFLRRRVLRMFEKEKKDLLKYLKRINAL
nr:hypothetical protein [Microgenomates group bacterium]